MRRIILFLSSALVSVSITPSTRAQTPTGTATAISGTQTGSIDSTYQVNWPSYSQNTVIPYNNNTSNATTSSAQGLTLATTAESTNTDANKPTDVNQITKQLHAAQTAYTTALSQQTTASAAYTAALAARTTADAAAATAATNAQQSAAAANAAYSAIAGLQTNLNNSSTVSATDQALAANAYTQVNADITSANNSTTQAGIDYAKLTQQNTTLNNDQALLNGSSYLGQVISATQTINSEVNAIKSLFADAQANATNYNNDYTGFENSIAPVVSDPNGYYFQIRTAAQSYLSAVLLYDNLIQEYYIDSIQQAQDLYSCNHGPVGACGDPQIPLQNAQRLATAYDPVDQVSISNNAAGYTNSYYCQLIVYDIQTYGFEVVDQKLGPYSVVYDEGSAACLQAYLNYRASILETAKANAAAYDAQADSYADAANQSRANIINDLNSINSYNSTISSSEGANGAYTNAMTNLTNEFNTLVNTAEAAAQKTANTITSEIQNAQTIINTTLVTDKANDQSAISAANQSIENVTNNYAKLLAAVNASNTALTTALADAQTSITAANAALKADQSYMAALTQYQSASSSLTNAQTILSTLQSQYNQIAALGY